MKDLTLVIMVAGLGSRFGGLKQLTPINDSGNFIIDYSVYDAKKAGFNKIVFIVKEETQELFKETIGKRIEGKIAVEYAIQDNKNVPKGVTLPEQRVKPLGTVHAILAAKPYVHENFAVINGDDFYGYDTFKKIVDFFNGEREENEFVMVPYAFEATKSDFGSVKRGVCEINKEGYLTNLIESVIEEVDGKYMATPQSGGKSFEISAKQAVSMNIFGMTPAYFKNMDDYMVKFFAKMKPDDIKCESLIAECLTEDVLQNNIKMKTIQSDSEWIGMTNPDDLAVVKIRMKELVDKGIYPKNLWS